jgi:hypothetical protein
MIAEVTFKKEVTDGDDERDRGEAAVGAARVLAGAG